jgi:hypothetical protein
VTPATKPRSSASVRVAPSRLARISSTGRRIDISSPAGAFLSPSVLPVTIATDAEAPMRLAPAWAMRSASSAVRTPPDALTPISVPTIARISATSSTVAPPLAKPVEVFTKAAPASLDSVQPMTF